jgi:hypothetical protein
MNKAEDEQTLAAKLIEIVVVVKWLLRRMSQLISSPQSIAGCLNIKGLYLISQSVLCLRRSNICP